MNTNELRQDNRPLPAWVHKWRRRLEIANKVMDVTIWPIRIATVVVIAILLWRQMT